MEARIYAEDPAHEFLPSTGRLERFEMPRAARVDTGVVKGGQVTPFYDPMIAKVIVHAPSREKAVRKLLSAVKRVDVWPVKTNDVFLARVLEHPEFRAGEIDTGFIAREGMAILPPADPDEAVVRSAAVQAIHSELTGWPVYLSWIDETWSSLPGPRPGNVWREAIGFRLNAEPSPVEIRLMHAGRIYEVALGDDLESHDYTAFPEGDVVAVWAPNGQKFRFTRAEAGVAAPGACAADGTLLSPMPGRVISVEVRQGDSVVKGQKLLTLEAMKMEHSLVAPFEGVVAELEAVEGAQVSEGTLLVRVEKE
jgi:3-methylcrotonyl-CoA carboxylase alpha subunit